MVIAIPGYTVFLQYINIPITSKGLHFYSESWGLCLVRSLQLKLTTVETSDLEAMRIIVARETSAGDGKTKLV